jgi:uncharacterized protein (DUF697 family)
LLTAVERLVEDAGNLISHVESLKHAVDPRGKTDDPDFLELVADRIISNYSTRSAIFGGVTAAPAMIPGVGSMLAVVGGSVVDITFMLKHEVEMAMCLTYLYGRDIRDETHRWLAYALAGIRMYEVQSGRNYFVDLAEAQLEALPKYTPRQLSKLAITAVGKVALLGASKSLVRVVPIVGIVVSASANKLLTTSVGWWCVDALERLNKAQNRDDGTIIEAQFT